MHLLELLSSFVLVTSVAARCGVAELAPQQFQEIESSFQSFLAANFTSNFATAAIVVPTYFHVITKGAGAQNGDLSDATIQKQLQVLNADYTGKVQFTLAGVQRINNPSWFVAAPDTSAYNQMKSFLRKGHLEIG
ncbi:hypothetical protein BDR26DRAFT_932925 [Obelidium mucronatum]|nr:hypothetical protein BDR26DRAFT_932925 [Obelidium mucronatum]